MRMSPLLLLLALARLLGTVSAMTPSDRGCSFFGTAGVDYADANLSVVDIGGAHPYSSCCSACDAWNAAGHGTNCTIGVMYHAGSQKHPSGTTPCALKASALRPVASGTVTAVKPGGSRPPPPPPPPPPSPSSEFRFASSLGNGVVLQAPSSIVWGFAPAGARISVGFDGQPLHAVTSAADSVWRVKLPPTPASMTASHNITATSSGRTITLSNVLFGDVWVCSGQSNMQCTSCHTQFASLACYCRDLSDRLLVYMLADPVGKAGCYVKTDVNCTAKPPSPQCVVRTQAIYRCKYLWVYFDGLLVIPVLTKG